MRSFLSDKNLNTMYAIKPRLNDQPLVPVLIGNCGYALNADRVRITLEQILNPRSAGDISGTLVVELWALHQPYHGGYFEGIPLAGLPIGVVFGQHALNQCVYDLAFQEPPPGTWYITLMLREWTAVGYVTRDFRTFNTPYTVTWSPLLIDGGNAKPVPETKPTAIAVPATPSVKVNKLALNQATVSEIAAIKGISAKLAAAIAAARPFKSFNEIKKVKGVGTKLLEKLRETTTLD